MLLATPALLGLGVLLLVWAWPANVFAYLAALVCFLLAFAVRPRPWRLPRDVILDPSSHPRLHRLVGEVAAALRVPQPDVLAVTTGWNAAAGRLGWRQRSTVALGLPLLAILEPQEWVALVGHELAHVRNGDPGRARWVGFALGTMDRWVEVLTPRSISEQHQGLAGYASITLLWVLSRIPWALLQVALHLAWGASQRAEYYADRLGAEVSGTDAFVNLLMNQAGPEVLGDVVHCIATDRTQRSLVAELRYRRARDDGWMRRLRRENAEAKELRLDATHPPTGYRIRMLRAHPVAGAQVRMGPNEQEAILAELEEDARRVERTLVQAYRYVWERR